jgi:succinate dehydrogenase/fumarate reductase cytochrome b subunit
VREDVADEVAPPRGTPSGEPAGGDPQPADPPTIDWSGRGRSDGDGAGTGPEPADGAKPRRRLAATAGAVAFAYVLWLVADLVVLGLSGTAYTSMHDALDSFPARIALSGAWLALLYHGLDGLRVAALDAVPRWQARDRAARGAVAFVVLAAWIPTALILCWPSMRGWFAQ